MRGGMAFDSDARVEELRFLLEVERGTRSPVRLPQQPQSERDMILHLVNEGYFNGLGQLHQGYSEQYDRVYSQGAANPFEEGLIRSRGSILNKLVGNLDVALFL